MARYLAFALIQTVIALVAVRMSDGAEPKISFKKTDTAVIIKLDETVIAEYVYRDPDVPRPYFAYLKTPSGIQVTRNHPPQPGKDATDHSGWHTGMWLSFGDLSGNDYWRLKSKTVHEEFIFKPDGAAGGGSFMVQNQYLSTDGKRSICREACWYVFRPESNAYSIDCVSVFHSDQDEFVFGDQEEMGLGIRVATPLAVDSKHGGRILDDQSRRNGSEIWGKTADWCDYSGPLSGKWVGVMVIPSRNNFRRCWAHARDYGLIVMNPFGRNAFTKQETSRVVVKRDETFGFRLGYTIVVHESATENDFNPAKMVPNEPKLPAPTILIDEISK